MPLRFGIVDALTPRDAGLPPELATLPGTLRAAGYHTTLVGKWHLGDRTPPAEHGFDRFYGFLGAGVDYFKHTNFRGTLDWQRDGKPLEETGYSTDLIAAEAVRQLQQRDPARPFFMEVAFNAPHPTLAAPAELIAKHGQGDAALYAAVIEALDTAIGRILTALDDQHLRDHTLVVFFSDNGAGRRFSSNAPLSDGKDTIREGGIRTPCVVRWPGHIPSNITNEHPVCVQDWFATLTEAAGLKPPAQTDGASQWSALTTGKPVPREPFLIASHDLALIAGGWKLVETGDGARSLYDLASDIGETTDQYVKQPQLAAALTKKLTALKQGLPPAPPRRTPPGGGRASR